MWWMNSKAYPKDRSCDSVDVRECECDIKACLNTTIDECPAYQAGYHSLDDLFKVTTQEEDQTDD
jgi:hypothetical protein